MKCSKKPPNSFGGYKGHFILNSFAVNLKNSKEILFVIMNKSFPLLWALLMLILISGCIQQPAQAPDAPKQATPVAIIGYNSTNTTQIGLVFDYFHYNPGNKEIKYPTLVKFPVVISPISYYIYNDTEINKYKYDLTLDNIRTAFEYWENATKKKVHFVQGDKRPAEGIFIKLIINSSTRVKTIGDEIITEETIGEAFPTGYVLDGYTLITGGEIVLKPTYGGSENRVQIIHEIGHVMGLAHNTNPHSVLYPINAYSQEITPDIIEALDVLYKDVPAPA